MKVFNRLKIISAPLFIGHKLALEELRKSAKDNRKALGIIHKLEENSDIAQFGSYCKGFAPDLVYYWYLGGKKLTPSLQEVNNFIYKYWKGEYKSFKDIPSSMTRDFRN